MTVLAPAARRGLRDASLLTLLLAAILELLAQTPLYFPEPGVIFGFIVIFAAFRNGTASGLFSSAIAIAYVFHYHQALHGGTSSSPRAQIVTSIVLPLMALLAGAMRTRLNQAQEKEELLRSAASTDLSRSAEILETMTDGFVSLSQDWQITYANRRAEQMLGIPRGRMVGRNALDVFPQAVGTSVHKAIAQALQQHEHVEIEEYYPPAQRWFDARVFPHGDEYSIYFRDVTSRKESEQAILFHSRLLDAIGQAVIATDLDGTIVYWNDAAERLFGWSAEEVGSSAGIAMTHAAYSEVEDARLYGRIRTGQPWIGEAQLVNKSGGVFAAAIADAPIRETSGRLIGMVRIVTDLSKRKSIEEQQRFLAEAGAILAATLDAESTIASVARLVVPEWADCCLVDLVDEDKSIRRLYAAHVDPSKEQIAREIARRYPLEPNSNHPITDVIRSGRSRMIGRLTDEFLRSLAFDSQHLGMMRDLAYEAGLIVPLIAHGKVLGAISLLSGESKREYSHSDLTVVEELARRAAAAIENARLYEAAIVASRAKSDFLAVMSHELRTPLTTIMGYTDLLLAGVPRDVDDPAKKYLDRIRTAAWHLLSIIEQILIYTRLEGGREELHVQRTTTADVVRDAALLIEPVAAEKGLEFRASATADVVVETDPIKLRQILVNLLANAVKFTDAGQVTLETTSDADAVSFIVRDTGIGIAPEHMEQIFDPFWQVDQSATRHVGGTGLGLSVVRRLARLLGGEVKVKSTPGAGAIFSVRLPTRWGARLKPADDSIAGHIGKG